MRNLIPIFLLGATLCSVAAAQTVFTIDWQLPPGFPNGSESPYFASRDSLAILSYDTVFVLNGLPDPAGLSTQVLAIPTPMSALADDTLLCWDATGELILVKGLPGNPVLVPTGIVGAGGGPFVPANPTTALCQKNALEWQILRHGPTGANLHTLNPPVWTHTASSFDGAPAGPDRFLVTGSSDHRTLVVFEGLSGPPSGFAVSSYQIPGTGNLDRFVVTESGTGVAVEYASNLEILLTVISFASGAPTFTTHSVSSPAWSSPVEIRSVCKAAGDNLICTWRDGSWDFPTAFVIGVDATPLVAHTWLRETAQSCWAQDVRSVAPDELVTGLTDPAGLTYHRFSGPNPGSRSLSVPGVYVETVLKPNPDTLLVVSEAGGPSCTDYWITVFTDLDGAATATPIGVTHYEPGYCNGPRMMTMSSGMVAALRFQLSPWPALTLIGLPTIYEVAASPGPGALHLSSSSGVPRIGSPFEILAWGVDPSAEVWLAFAAALGEPYLPGPPFAPNATLHLDPASFLGLIAAPSIGPGLWSADLGLELLPPALAGWELYVQGVSLSGAWSHSLSNTLLFIPG